MRFLACAVLALGALAAEPAASQLSGVVFRDANANGRRDPGEAPVAGVAVSNGRDIVRSDAGGRYSLPGSVGRFVFITRPAGFSCPAWYRRGAGDFGLVPAPDPEAFGFIQFSDAHVYDRPGDPLAYATRHRWRWLPNAIGDRIGLFVFRRSVEPRFTDDGVAGLRRALAPGLSTRGLSDREVFGAYREEFERPGSRLADVVPQIRAAFRELALMSPDFYLSTGDQVLEGNLSPPEPLVRWMRSFEELAGTLPAPVYVSIGNNEIAGSENADFTAADPRHGKRTFEAFHGPTYYSFDRGRFHFVTTDTHRNDAAPGDGDDWTITRLPADARAWLEADLALHRERTLVVLNHEPFHFDPSWPFPVEWGIRADDEGLLERFGVDYALSGHVHMNGVAQQGATTFITTGALSGQRWRLPADVHHRGYRLFHARGGRLFSAWKRLGEPVVAFVEAGVPAEPGESRTLVMVFADRSGAFPEVRLELDGRPLPLNRWGAWFASARLPPRASGTLELVATRASGESERARMRLEPASTDPRAGAP